MGEPSPTEVRSRLLAWYAAKRRDLPWRRTRDPYRILVAEYLLQRTRIASGTPYYERFLMRFPTVQDLAAASLDDVLAVWEGLGFYGRARRLHAAARVIVAEHAGKVPPSYEVLAALPGIGPYTAGAIASIAFALIEANGRVLLVRRESGTLLGGLWALPGGEVPSRLSERTSLPMLVKKQTGSVIQVGPLWSPVDRTFSHRKWFGSIYRCSPTRHPSSSERIRWIPIAEALQLPLVPFHREALESLSGLESFALR